MVPLCVVVFIVIVALRHVPGQAIVVTELGVLPHANGATLVIQSLHVYMPAMEFGK